MKDETKLGANILNIFFYVVKVLVWWKVLAAGGLGKVTFVRER